MKIKDLEVVRHRLEAPLVLSPQPGHEVYLHTLVGSGTIEFATGDHDHINGRRTVFSTPVDGWLLHNCGAVIQPHGALDVLVASVALTEKQSTGMLRVTPKMHEIGEGNYKRTVYEILGGAGPSERLRLGETFNVKGGWSSWPPHSFDHDPKNAPEFEEVFLPFLRPKGGSALLRRQGLYCDGSSIDDAIPLTSGALVSVPLGSHPIVGGPDTELMYVFAYVSPTPKNYGIWAEEAGTYL